MQVQIVGCSPAWPNPGGAQSGYLVDGRVLLDCGPGVLGRLRTENGSWPEVDAIVITHFHLDHWGDVVPWVWGRMFGLGRAAHTPELWVPPNGKEELELFGGTFGTPWMFERTFEIREYPEEAPFTVSGLEIRATRVPHYTLRTYALRVTDGERTLAYSGRLGADRPPCRRRPRRRPLHLRGDARTRRAGRRARAGTCRPRRRSRRIARRAPAACC